VQGENIELRWLWVQEASKEGRFLLKTVKTDDNPGDIGTKYSSEARLSLLLDILGMRRLTQGPLYAAMMLSLFPGVRGQDDGEEK
jgi:hypothetical protein